MFNIESSQISRLDSYGKYMFLAARRSPGIPPPPAPPVLNAGKTQVRSRTTHPRSATRAARVRDPVTGLGRNTGPSPLVDINDWRDSLQYNKSSWVPGQAMGDVGSAVSILFSPFQFGMGRCL